MTEAQLETAFFWLEEFMASYRNELVALARGRYALGVFRYPSGPLYRKSRDELAADIAEEVGDAIVYAARRLALQ